MRSMLVLAAAVVVVLAAGCARVVTPAKMWTIELPEQYNTPDGMVVGKAGDILLSCPNYNDPSPGAFILKIGQDDQVSELVKLPEHPETGKPCGPLGIAEGPDGHLYVADNQSVYTADPKSRLLRIVMKEGKAERVEVLVTGLFAANAVACHGDSVYVTDSKFSPDPTPPMRSGVYRFKLAELNPAKPLAVKPGGADPHVCVRLTTENTDWVGANGMAFGPDGTMYVCNFGDAKIEAFTFSPQGKLTSRTLVAKRHGMLSTDGLKVHPKTGELYVADFLGNAVHRVNPRTGQVTTLAKNGNTDGRRGLLDRPSEPCIRGNKLYVANIDLPAAGNKFDKPYTVTVIELEE